MVAEFLVVVMDYNSSPDNRTRILESFKTQAEAETYVGILQMEPSDNLPIFKVWKTDASKVRKRQSYGLWEKLQDFLSKEHSTVETMEFLYRIMDEHRGFGSETNAWYAKESLFYFLQGLGNEDGVDCFVCKVQNKVQELEEGQLHEISDLCMSELDRREEKVPSIKMEAVACK